MSDAVRALGESLAFRLRPEDAAALAWGALEGGLSLREDMLLRKAAGVKRGRPDVAGAAGLVARLRAGEDARDPRSSMPARFFKPVGCAVMVATAPRFFAGAHGGADGDDPAAVAGLLDTVSPEIHKARARNHYADDRLNRADREAQGLDLSRRQYNKRFRFLARFERKLARFVKERRRVALTKIGRSGLASALAPEDRPADPATAALVAYLTARRNRRSTFSDSGQDPAYDEVAAALYARCEASDTTDWFALAHAYPTPAVLARLDEGQRQGLLARWMEVLREAAEFLAGVWEASDIDRETMIVRRGNDSSTWNTVANAFNTGRDAWIALADSLGHGDLIDGLCPGKVLRLMAADVVAWHGASGADLDPDTKVWAELPLPWQVFRGEVACPRRLVEEVCAKHGVHPVKKGWVAPRPKHPPVPTRPTPELVHGVAVANPALAAALKKAGWFSGKGARPLAEGDPGAAVARDAAGFVTGVTAADGEGDEG